MAPSKRATIFEKIREERGETNLLQVATFGTEGSRSAVLAACRGYRSAKYPNGIDIDVAQYIASLIPQERGFLWPISDMIEGNEEKDRKPNQTFIDELNKYPGLLDIIQHIEGLVNKRSQHASGVILYNNSPFDTTAFMRSSSGDLTTQFSLHESEQLGDTKFDFLVTEITDKIINATLLLQKDNYFEQDMTLRQLYNKHLHPAVLDLNNNELWDALAKGTVADVFQFNTDVGLQGVMLIKPKNPIQLMMTNALIRLNGEKGQERPLDRYKRMNDNIQLWYNECKMEGLSEEEIHYLEPYYIDVGGTPTTQERLMLLCMDEHIGHFTLKEANAARKVCSKKKLAEIPALEEKFISQCPNPNFGKYVWKTAILPQLSYAFAEPHALAYSYIAIQTLYLATQFPEVYWNCACLITNSGGDALFYEGLKNENIKEVFEEEIVDIYEQEDSDCEYEDSADRTSKKKKKNKTVDYGKISSAIGQFQAQGIHLLPPDINRSAYTFLPDSKNNTIICGIYGLTRISASLVQQIIAARPYTSIEDFTSKVKVNKTQMLTLLKCGAFDTIYPDRMKAIQEYVASIAGTKNKLTMANIPMLLQYKVLPDECDEYIEIYQFNKFIKKYSDGINITMPQKAFEHYCDHFDVDLLNDDGTIGVKVWDKYYKKQIEPLSQYIKEDMDSLLHELNEKIIEEQYDASANGSISHFEMESMSFYYHDHELANVDNFEYGLENFFALPEEPQVERSIQTKDGQEIKFYHLSCIAGTVLDKNKMKNTVTLLTTDGVVNVKIWKNQFAKYDKQISEVDASGKKHVIEKSWFKRGNLLYIQGMRRGNSFIPKAYKNGCIYKNPIMKITKVDGTKMEFINKRYDEGDD